MLPAQMQFNVPTITCAQLDQRPAGVDLRPEAAGGRLRGRRVEVPARPGQGARHRRVRRRRGARPDQRQWVVSLDFTSDGQGKWTSLTREAFNNEGQACDATALGQDGKCRVAVVLDNKVVSSPEIQGVLTGNSQITGQLHPEGRQHPCRPAALRRAAGDLRAAGGAERHRHAGRQPPARRSARGRHRHAAGHHLRVLLLPAARLGDLPEPDPLRRCWSSARWWCSAGRSASR